MSRIEWLTHDDFAGRIGESFTVANPGLVLLLAEATQGVAYGGSGPDGQERLQFSIVFRGPAEPALSQDTYTLTHDELGELTLFLVPVGIDADGATYEAAFA